jgi:hypothetical protein
MLPHRKRSDDSANPNFEAQKRAVVDAEIERRRISMIQRDNMRRAYRGEPLVKP